MKKNDWYFIIFAFLIWRFGLFILLFIFTKFVPLQTNFLGGGLENYLANPHFWSWANFDGEHYLSIAQNGYGNGEYAFFPLFPLLIKYIGEIFGGGLVMLNVAANLIVNISFFLALVGFFKLARLDYPEKTAKLATILLLLFPTSFYFVSIYNESLFLAFAVWSFYFARRKRWFIASFLGIFLTATRFVGLIIFPAILIEWLVQNVNNKLKLKNFSPCIIFIPTGLLAYMYYLDKVKHDMFAFFNELSGFGEQRSSHLITLPQVLYRYIVKILPNLNTSFFPVIFITIFEFFIGVLYLILSLFSFFKLRLSYAIFVFLGYLIPTFSGSFSSLPRYVVVLFPVFLLFALLFEKRKVYLIVFGSLSSILLIISFALFARGYWLS